LGYLDVTVHVTEGVQVLHGLAHIPEIPSYLMFSKLTVAALDLVIEGTPTAILQHHVCFILLPIVVVLVKLDYIGMA
jgi:hypothetical protein